MKRTHARILEYLRCGGGIKRLGRQKKIFVSVWVRYGVYDQFVCRQSTIDEMEQLGLISCVDYYAHDMEWVLSSSQIEHVT